MRAINILIAYGQIYFSFIRIEQATTFRILRPIFIHLSFTASHNFQGMLIKILFIGNNRTEIDSSVPAGTIIYVIKAGAGVGTIVKASAAGPKVVALKFTAGIMLLPVSAVISKVSINRQAIGKISRSSCRNPCQR